MEAIRSEAEELLDIRLKRALDRGRLGAYGQRTLAGAPGASPFSQVTQDRTPYPRTLREVCDLSDEERPSNVLRRAACQRVQED